MKVRIEANTPEELWPVWLNLREVALITGHSYIYLTRNALNGNVLPMKLIGGICYVHRSHLMKEKLQTFKR